MNTIIKPNKFFSGGSHKKLKVNTKYTIFLLKPNMPLLVPKNPFLVKEKINPVTQNYPCIILKQIE